MLNDPMGTQSAKSRPREALNNLNSSTKNFQRKKNGGDVYNKRNLGDTTINHNYELCLDFNSNKLQRKNCEKIGNI